MKYIIILIAIILSSFYAKKHNIPRGQKMIIYYMPWYFQTYTLYNKELLLSTDLVQIDTITKPSTIRTVKKRLERLVFNTEYQSSTKNIRLLCELYKNSYKTKEIKLDRSRRIQIDTIVYFPDTELILTLESLKSKPDPER